MIAGVRPGKYLLCFVLSALAHLPDVLLGRGAHVLLPPAGYIEQASWPAKVDGELHMVCMASRTASKQNVVWEQDGLQNMQSIPPSSPYVQPGH